MAKEDAKYTEAQLRDGIQRALQMGNRDMALKLKGMVLDGNFKEIVNDAKSFSQGFSQGATVGFGDEISASVRAGTEQLLDPTMRMLGHMTGNVLPGDEGKSGLDVFSERKGAFFPGGYLDRFDAALASNRGQLAASREEDPLVTFGGELVGGVAQGAGGGLKTTAGKGLQEGAKALAKTGFKYGAAAGYGYSEADPLRAFMSGDRDAAKEEVLKAAQDMAVGGGVGYLAGYGTPYVTAGIRSLGRYFAGLTPDGKNVIMNEKAKADLIEAYQRDVAGGYITPQQAMKELESVPDLVIGDLGPNLRNEMMRLGQMNTAGGSGIRQFVTARNKKQFDRVYPRLAKALTGGNDPNFGVLQRQMLEEKQKAAGALYEAIGDVPAVLNNRMRNILKNPQAKKAIKHANTLREIEGKPPIDPDTLLDQGMTTDELHSVLEGMRSVTDALYKGKGSGKIAHAYKTNIYKPMRDLAYDLNSDLAEAQKVWRDFSSLEEAMEAGEKIFRDDYEIAEMLLEDGFSDADVFAYKLGVTKAFRGAMENKSFDADLLKSISNTPKKQKLLQMAFGDEDGFRQFMNYLDSEDKMFQTMSDATANSLTTRRLLQQDADVGKRFASQFGYNAGLGRQNQQPVGIGPRLSAFMAETAADIFNPEAARLRKQMDLANRQSQMLLSRDLQGVTQPNTLGGLLDTGVPSSASVGVPGLLSTGALFEDYGQ